MWIYWHFTANVWNTSNSEFRVLTIIPVFYPGQTKSYQILLNKSQTHKKYILQQAECVLPIQTSPNWPAPRRLSSFRDSRGISQASFSQGFWGLGLRQGVVRDWHNPSLCSVDVHLYDLLMVNDWVNNPSRKRICLLSNEMWHYVCYSSPHFAFYTYFCSGRPDPAGCWRWCVERCRNRRYLVCGSYNASQRLLFEGRSLWQTESSFLRGRADQELVDERMK